MKTKASIALASAAIAIAMFLTSNPAAPTSVQSTAQKAKRPAAHAATLAAPVTAPEPEVEIPEDRGEAAHLADWQARFNKLLQQGESSDNVVRLLLAEMDAVYGNWVASQIAPLAELAPGERYDRLAEIEISVQEGAAAILDLLEIEGSRHVSVLAGPLEVVSAEIQYAESAPDPASRLALLRLDRERESRMEQALAITGEPAKSHAITDLDAWYDTGLGAIFTANETE